MASGGSAGAKEQSLSFYFPMAFTRNDIHHFFELLWVMTEKELRARYKYTIFGFMWIVLNPILQMLVIGFVFTFIMKEPIENYYFFLLVGLLIWNFFSLSLTKATPSIVYERALIKKANFFQAVIPLSIVLSNFVHFVLAFILILVPITFLDSMNFSRLLHLVFGFSLLMSFTVGVSLFTSALNVRYRDVNFFVQALLIIWFYTTPIIYPLNLISKHLLWLWSLNPMTSIVQLFQYALLDVSSPDSATVITNTVIIVAAVCVGIVIFQKERRCFDDWL